MDYKTCLLYTSDKDLTYKAQWLKMEYTLQFKTGGGTTIEPIKGNYGDKINAPENPTRKEMCIRDRYCR